MARIRRLLFSLLIQFTRIRFKQWIELEDQKLQIKRAHVESREEFPKLVTSFLSLAFPAVPHKTFEHLYWAETISLFSRVATVSSFKQYLPLVNAARDLKDDTAPMPWEYQGRTWHFYSHMLAATYGWTLEYIARLPVFEALAKVEEILLQQQLDKEFEWGMSDASVIYDTKTQTSKPNPLPRPYWMKSANPTDPLPIKRIRIPQHMLPVGLVNYDAVTDDYKPKEITAQPTDTG